MGLKHLLRKCLPPRVSSSLRDFVWRLLDIKWTLRSKIHVEICGLSDWVVFSDIFVDGEYDEAVERAFSSSVSGECINILDVGANVGFFSLRCLDLAIRRGLARKVLRLTLVEGSPPVYQELQRRMQVAGIDVGKLELINGLAGMHAGIATMESSSLNCMNRVTLPQESGAIGHRVSYVDLRPYFSEAKIVHLLKCDIEGSEQIFLETYAPQLQVVKAVVIELHHDRCNTQRCLQLLEEAGLTNRRILRETSTFSVAFLWR